MDEVRNPMCSEYPKARLLQGQPRDPAPARRQLALDQRRHAHQWITPAGENTMWPQGVSVEKVPDMTVCCGAQ